MIIPKLQVFKEKSEHRWNKHQPLTSAQQVVELYGPKYERYDREVFSVLALNNKHRPIGLHEVSIGSANATLVSPRELFKVLLLVDALAFIILHNHPSGDPTPSREDIDITKRIKSGASILQLRMVDHVVLGSDGDFASFADLGYLDYD